MERKVQFSDFVLVICTPTYLRRWLNQEQEGLGLGAQWESLLTRNHLYLSPGLNNKFVPVLLDDEHVSSIPIPLINVTRVVVRDEADFGRVRDRLLNIAPAEKPLLRTSLVPVSVAKGFFSETFQPAPNRPSAAAQSAFDHGALGLSKTQESAFSNLFPVIYPSNIQTARVTLKRGTKFNDMLNRVWKEEGFTGAAPLDFLIDARILYRFAGQNEQFWDAMRRRHLIHPMNPKASSSWADSERMADKNQFIKLLNRSLDQLCATSCMPHRVIWSREMKCHLFVARPGTRRGTIRVRAITKESRREVYKAIPDKFSTNSDAIQHWQHQAFRHFFVRYGGRWFLNVIPFWAFTSDGRGHPSRWQRKSSANMRKPEKNRAVLGHVMFWASVVCKEPDLFRPNEPFRVERPLELQLSPSVNDDAWITIARDSEKADLVADLELPL